MTYQDIVAEMQRLTIHERLSLIEELSRSVQAELAVSRRDMQSLERLHGILKTDGPPPADEEIKDIIANSLIEKHS